MLTDDQIIDEVRRALAAETDEIDPRPGLLGRIHQELASTSPGRRQARRPRLRAGALVAALAAGVALAIAVVALVFLHHSTNANPTPAPKPVAVGTVRIAAQAPDPQGGLPWGLRTIRTRRLVACLQIGRLKSGRIGQIGPPSLGSDGGFQPIPQNFICGRTDARGYLFLSVSEHLVPAIASSGGAGGCDRNESPARRHLPPSKSQTPVAGIGLPGCHGLRDIEFGVLGPDAISITYLINHHSVIERTGPDGAYIVVLPAAPRLCTYDRFGREVCSLSAGQMTTSTVRSGVITSVTYSNGRVCRLATSAEQIRHRLAAAFCPNLDYAH